MILMSNFAARKLSKESFGLVPISDSLHEIVTPRDFVIQKDSTYNIDCEVGLQFDDKTFGMIMPHVMVGPKCLCTMRILRGRDARIIVTLTNFEKKIYKFKRGDKIAYLLVQRSI